MQHKNYFKKLQKSAKFLKNLQQWQPVRNSNLEQEKAESITDLKQNT